MFVQFSYKMETKVSLCVGMSIIRLCSDNKNTKYFLISYYFYTMNMNIVTNFELKSSRSY